MILPELDGLGEILADFRDVRVPTTFTSGNPVRALAGYLPSPQCPQRHLWDALETLGPELYDEDADPDGHDCVSTTFRLTLTCVRCGLVYPLRGVLRYGTGVTSRQLQPEPLRAGRLRAQQIGPSRLAGLEGDWTVHDTTSDTVVGQIFPEVTRRGRRFHVGRLKAWPRGYTVQAPTVAACLRKLARTNPATPDPAGVSEVAR
jgi:hypothetical protein